jgi:hypothetical protein
VEFTKEDTEKAIRDLGLSEDVAKSLIELDVALTGGRLTGETPRSPETTTETSFEEFAEVFAGMLVS